MKEKSFWKLSLLIYVFLLSPVSFAQEKQTVQEDKTALLEIGRLDLRKSNKEVSTVTPATHGFKLIGKLVEVKMRVSGNELILEFMAPLPNKSQKLRITSDLELGNFGEASCSISKGVYDIDYSRAQNGTVIAPIAANVSAHRRRRTRREMG